MELACRNVMELGFPMDGSLTVDAQLKAVSLAYCQQREIVLTLQLTASIQEFATERGMTFPEAMYTMAQHGAHDKVNRDIKENHELANKYRKELQEAIEENKKPTNGDR